MDSGTSFLRKLFSALSNCLPFSNLRQGDEASNSSMDNNHNQSCRYTYDVFISFRGADTRNTFVDHLYAHLTRKGIFAFMDDKRLQKGESLSPQLLQAIQNSRTSIVVFSETYARSTWCLEEMATIVDCCKELNQKVFPVFYDVDPSHVRYQSGPYYRYFDLHMKKFKRSKQNKVVRWTKAMKFLANLVGWDVRNKPESIEIETIVQAVIKSLNHKFSRFTNDLVGMQPRIEELEKLLQLGSMDGDFRVLGILGMSGVGKTTHAMVLYDRISYQFDVRCFINNTNKLYMDDGIVAVQRQILRQALDERNLDSYGTCEIAGIMLSRLHSGLKVLLVLDNVDQFEQLQELGINPKLLGRGSRVIITTRDEHLLRVYGADKIHKVPLLNSSDASELFLKKAFKFDYQTTDCVALIPEVLKYAQNLPLAIEVVGSFLCTRDATQWRDVLDRLKNNPYRKIMDVLQISFDGLQHEEKEIFLHIACFFKGEREDYVRRILDACGLYPHIGIQRVIEKSLITIKNQEIHMHDMLQELGKKIVRDRFLDDPGLWSRVWRCNDFYHVLKTKTGTNNNVKAIVLDQKENFPECVAEGFSNLSNLALLILYHNNFSGNLDFLSNNLRYLLWHGYPFTSLPSNFEPHYLVELNMPDSSIQRLWDGRKELPDLKRMDLSNSKYLIETPKFFWTPKLERLDFTGCTNLIQEPLVSYDVVIPWDWKNIVFSPSCIPGWFSHQFDGGSIVRIVDFNEFDATFGFAFCVAFEVNNRPANSGSPPDSFSSALPHPFYLSFESEHTEERFDMPLSLDLNKIDGSKHLWLIYISQEHCHFLKTGAHITFKACQGLFIKKWGVRGLLKNEVRDFPSRLYLSDTVEPQLFLYHVQETSIKSGPKIQLPYNWLVTEEEEVEISRAKSKETDLSNLGL